MKRIAILLFSAFLMGVSSTTWAQTKQRRVVIKGLVCSLCGQGLEKKFKALPEIKNVKVQFSAENPVTKKKENVVNLTVVDGKSIAKVQIETIVKDAGYNVSTI